MKTNWNALCAEEFTLYFSQETDGRLWHMAYVGGQLYLNQNPVFSRETDGVLYWNDGADPKKELSDRASVGRLESMDGERIFAGVMMTESGTLPFKAAIDKSYELTFIGKNQQTFMYDLVYGSYIENGDLVQTIELYEHGEKENLAICRGIGVVEEPDGSHHPHICGTLLPGLKDFAPFGFFDIRIESDYLHISGSAWQSESTRHEQAPTCQIQGVRIADNRELPPANQQKEDIGCSLTHRLLLDRATEPYVETLFYLPMPIMENVDKDLPQKMTQLMLYAISPEQLSFLGDPKKPELNKDITPEMAGLLTNKTISDFLTKDYYYACLSSLLINGEDGPCKKLITDIPQHEERIKGYYSESLSTSMCKNPGYAALSESLHAMVYVQSLPEIKPYLAERTKWAKLLHRYALYTPTSDLMTDEYTHQKQSRLQHMVQVLKYLDPTPKIKMDRPQDIALNHQCCTAKTAQDYYLSYGSNLYYKLINRWLTMKAYADTPSDLVMTKNERMSYYETAGKRILTQLYNGTYLPPELEELKKQIDESIKAGIIKVPDDAYPWISVVLLELETVFAGVSDACILPAAANFLKKYPLISSGIRSVTLILAQGLMLWNAGAMLEDWEQQTAAQRAQSVLSIAYSVTDVVGAVEVVTEGVRESISARSKQIRVAAKTASPTASSGPAEAASMAKFGSKFMKEAQKAASQLSVLSKFVGGLLAAFAFAMSICDIVNDMAIYGSCSVLALDIVVTIINGVAMLAVVGFYFVSTFAMELIGSCIFCALLPGIGWACTIVGILLAFILYWVKKSSKTIKEIYIETNCVPFVKALLLPQKTLSWIW